MISMKNEQDRMNCALMGEQKGKKTVGRAKTARNGSVVQRWMRAFLLLAVAGTIVLVGCEQAAPNGGSTGDNGSGGGGGTTVPRVDIDNDNLIDISNLDMLNNIRYNLAGTSYKTSADDAGVKCGADSTVACQGYELTASLGFADGGSYKSGSVNSAWRPSNPSNPGASTNAGWTPIGDGVTPFTTTFEGNSFNISHLYVRNITNVNNAYIGLFGQIGASGMPGTVRNLAVVNGNVYGGSRDDAIGIIAGRLVAGSTIRESSVAGGSANGGAAPSSSSGGITDSSDIVSGVSAISSAVFRTDPGLSMDSDRIGGLVGESSGTITASYAASEANGGARNNDFVGGLVGLNNRGGGIVASYATGVATGGAGDDSVGALVGRNTEGTITASYATGSADGGAGTGDSVGALVGFDSGGSGSSATIFASYAFGSATGNERVGDPATGAPSSGSALPMSGGMRIRGPGALTAENTSGCTDPAQTTEAACERGGGTWTVWSTVADGVWDFGDGTKAPGLTYTSGTNMGRLIPGQEEILTLPTSAITTPENLTAVVGNGQVTLTWNTVSGAASYNVYRQAAGESMVALAANVRAVTTYIDINLTNGTAYTYTVRAMDLISEGPRSDPVTATPLALSGAPTLTATAGDGEVALSWTSVATAVTYKLYRAVQVVVTPASGTLVATITHPAVSHNDISHNNGNQLSYVVVAVDSAGNEVPSAVKTATPLAPLSAPTLTATAGAGTVALSWNAVTGATTYKLYRAIGSTVTAASGTLVATVSHPTVSYDDTGRANGIQLAYAVVVSNANGAETISAVHTVTPLAPLGTPVLTAAAGDDKVVLTWVAVADADRYIISRSGGVGGLRTFSNVNSGYTDTLASNGNAYTYVLIAVNVNGVRSNSASVIVTPLEPPTRPAGFTATPGDSTVALSWNAVTGAATYKLYRAVGSTVTPSSSTLVTTVTHPTVSYNDTGRANGTQLAYAVVAANANGVESVASLSVTATPLASPSTPVLTVAPGDSTVALSWNAVSGAATYKLYRAEGATVTPSSSTLITTVNHPTVSYEDTGRINGTQYAYVVVASNANGDETSSIVQTATPLAPISAPTITVTAGDGTVALGWNAISGVAAYKIYRAVGSTVIPSSSTVVATLGNTAVSHNDLGRTNGTQLAYAVGALNANDTETISAVQTATPLATPSSPTGLTATAGNGQISIDWAVVTGAVTYTVYRTDSANPQRVSIATGLATSDYIDRTAVNGTAYTYAVAAVNANGSESPRSSTATATPLAPAGAPTGLIATPTDGQVSLDWAVVTGAGTVTYTVYRTDSANSRASIMTGLTDSDFVDTTAVNGTEYIYTVTATNVGDESLNSNSVTATPYAAPGSPINLIATPANGQVSLDWAAVTGAGTVIYTVYRTDSANSRASIMTGLTDSDFVDTTAVNGTAYTYTVTATNVGGESPNSSTVTATPRAVPAAPTLTATVGDGQVSIDWAAITGAGTVTYTVYRTDSANSRASIMTGIATSDFVDTTAVNGTAYTYTVTATNVGGESPNSNLVNATPLPPRPSAPANLTITAGNGQVSIDWDVVNGADTYTVYRSDSAGVPASIATGLTVSEYVDITAVNGTAYTYAVRAVNLAGEGNASSPANATPRIAAPTGLRATVGNGQVSLDWNDRTGIGTITYAVYRSNGIVASASIATGLIASEYIDRTVANGTAYTYTVRAVDAGGESRDGTAVSATPTISAPTNLVGTAGDAQAVLVWDAVSGADEYYVYRDTVRIAMATTIAATTYTDTGLTNGDRYGYTVRAVDSNGVTADSIGISIVPVDSSATPSDPADLVGTWSRSFGGGTDAITFTNNRYTRVFFDTTIDCTYTANTNTITLSGDCSGGASTTATYSISGNTLTYNLNPYTKQ